MRRRNALIDRFCFPDRDHAVCTRNSTRARWLVTSAAAARSKTSMRNLRARAIASLRAEEVVTIIVLAVFGLGLLAGGVLGLVNIVRWARI
jgi:hypothetical protein